MWCTSKLLFNRKMIATQCILEFWSNPIFSQTIFLESGHYRFKTGPSLRLERAWEFKTLVKSTTSLPSLGGSISDSILRRKTIRTTAWLSQADEPGRPSIPGGWGAAGAPNDAWHQFVHSLRCTWTWPLTISREPPSGRRLGVAFIAVPGRQGVTLGMDFLAGEVAPGFCQINANWCCQSILFTDYLIKVLSIIFVIIMG